MYRPTVAILSEEAIVHNLTCLKKKLRGKTTHIIAVVKANGYGHGAALISELAIQHGADALAVATIDEALTLREKFPKVPILVLGPVVLEAIPTAQRERITITVPSLSYAEALVSYVDDIHAPLTIHMKVDSGMGRIGIRTEKELRQAERLLRSTKKIHLEGVFTHFSKADENRKETEKQFQHFLKMVDNMEERPNIVHAANTAAALLYEHMHLDAVRFGIGLYGSMPSPFVASQHREPLQPVLRLETALSFVKKVPKDEAISYGGRYVTEDVEWIGTLPIGYADGLSRNLYGQEVLIDGQRVPIVGTICMDQCMVRLPQQYPIGERVTLIGRQGTEQITAEQWAERLGTIVYEVYTSLSSRIERKVNRN